MRMIFITGYVMLSAAYVYQQMECLVSYLSEKINFTNPGWPIFSRVVAAIFAGYALATTSALFLGQLFLASVGQYEAIHIGMLLSFIIYAAAAMWVFTVDSAKKAWLVLIGVNVLLVVLTSIFRQVNS